VHDFTSFFALGFGLHNRLREWRERERSLSLALSSRRTISRKTRIVYV
jgi:hypothetical protein